MTLAGWAHGLCQPNLLPVMHTVGVVLSLVTPCRLHASPVLVTLFCRLHASPVLVTLFCRLQIHASAVEPLMPTVAAGPGWPQGRVSAPLLSPATSSSSQPVAEGDPAHQALMQEHSMLGATTRLLRVQNSAPLHQLSAMSCMLHV